MPSAKKKPVAKNEERLPVFCPRCAARGPCHCARRPRLYWTKERGAQFNGFFLTLAASMFATAAYFAAVAYEDGRSDSMMLSLGLVLAACAVAWMFWDGASRLSWRFRAEDDSASGRLQTLDFEVVSAKWFFIRTLDLPLTVTDGETRFRGTAEDFPDGLGGNLGAAQHHTAAVFLALLFSMVASGALLMRARVRVHCVFPLTGTVKEEPWEVVVLRQSATTRSAAEAEVLAALGSGFLPIATLLRTLRRNGGWDEVLAAGHEGSLAGFVDALNGNQKIAEACVKNLRKVL